MFDLTTAIRSFFSNSEEPQGRLEPSINDRLDLHSGTPYWSVRNAETPNYPVLDEDVRADVVIIGGGITGALCAYAFAQSGLATVVVDARAIGKGSTCASTALLQYEIDTPLHKLVDLVGEKNAIRSYQLCAQAVARAEVIAQEIGAPSSFTRRPSLQYASKRSHRTALVREQAIRQANGLPCTLLDDAASVRRALSFDAPMALHTELAAEMDPVEFTHALHAHSIGLGCRVFENTTIVDHRDNGSGIELRTANGHLVRAKDLVFATGYESRDLLPADVVRLHSTYAMVSKAGTAAEPWPGKALIWETASPYLYLRTAPEDRIIIGGRDVPFRTPALRDALLERKTSALAQDFRDLMPDIPFHHEHAWCGTFGSTKDGLPYIDNGPLDTHSYYALGMGGNGITFSVIAAEMIRDRILGRPNLDGLLFRFDR